MEVTRLGHGLMETGRLSERAMARTSRAICEFKHLADGQGINGIAAVGTRAMRNASNTNEFISQVKNNCGLNIEVISGQDEAHLSYLAVKADLPRDTYRLVILDLGGGSAEFIYGSKNKIEKSYSLDIGALHLTEKHLRHDPVFVEELQALRDELHKSLARLEQQDKEITMIGLGGAITNICTVKLQMSIYDPARIQGYRLSRQDVIDQVALYSGLSLEQRRDVLGMDAKRAEIILAGAVIVEEIMKRLGVDVLTVSDRGLRHGLILDRFVQKQKTRNTQT